MKNLWLVAGIFLALLANVPNAAALSTDSRPTQNMDGSPKFADPDEQMPGFMVSPDSSGNGGALSFGSSGAENATPPTVGDTTPGARDFDRAFAHQQGQE